jgi:hypothetical protein
MQTAQKVITTYRETHYGLLAGRATDADTTLGFISA